MSPEMPGFGTREAGTADVEGPVVRDSDLWRELEDLRWSASAERTERLLDETPDVLELEAQELQRLDAAADRLWRQQEAGHYAQVQHLKRRFVDAQAQLRSTQEQEYGQLLEERCRREARGPRFGPRILELQHAERQLEKLGELGQAKQVKEKLRRMEADERQHYMTSLTGEFHNKEEQLHTQQLRKREALRRRFQRQLASLLLAQEDQQLTLAHRVQHLSARASRRHTNRQLDEMGARPEAGAIPWDRREYAGPPFRGLAATEDFLSRSHSQPLLSRSLESDQDSSPWQQGRAVSPMRSASPSRQRPGLRNSASAQSTAFPWHGTGTPPRRNFARDAPVGFMSGRAPPSVPMASWVPNTALGSPDATLRSPRGSSIGSPRSSRSRSDSPEKAGRGQYQSSPVRQESPLQSARGQEVTEAAAQPPWQWQRQSHPDTYYLIRGGSLPNRRGPAQMDQNVSSLQSATWSRDLRKTAGGGYTMEISPKKNSKPSPKGKLQATPRSASPASRSKAAAKSRSVSPVSPGPRAKAKAAQASRARTPPAPPAKARRAPARFNV